MADITKLFDLADPRIKGIWDEKQTQLSSTLEYSKLGLTDHNAEILNTVLENFSGLGIASEIGEAEAYPRDDINAGYNITVTPTKKAIGIAITEEMLRFNLWPKINNLVSGVANALNARIDTDAAKLFYLGFGTTFMTGGDSVALFSASHPTSPTDSTTQSNTGSLALSYDNLKTVVQAMNRFKDDKSIQLRPCTKLKLIVPIEKRERALEVLRSIGNPDSANRVNNVFANGGNQGGGIELVVSHWVPATTYGNYWWVVDEERANLMARMQWGWRPKFDDDKVVNNGTKIYTGSTMFKPAFQTWQWAMGESASS